MTRLDIRKIPGSPGSPPKSRTTLSAVTDASASLPSDKRISKSSEGKPGVSDVLRKSSRIYPALLTNRPEQLAESLELVRQGSFEGLHIDIIEFVRSCYFRFY